MNETNVTSVQSFSTSPFPQTTLPAPIIEPPRSAPALPPRDLMKASIPTAPSVTEAFNNNDKFHTESTFGGTNIFQTNPFEIPSTKSDPFGMTAFDNNPTPFSKSFAGDDWSMPQKSVTVNSLSLDELDPLKK